MFYDYIINLCFNVFLSDEQYRYKFYNQNSSEQ